MSDRKAYRQRIKDRKPGGRNNPLPAERSYLPEFMQYLADGSKFGIGGKHFIVVPDVPKEEEAA